MELVVGVVVGAHLGLRGSATGWGRLSAITAGMMIVVDLYRCIIAWEVSMGIFEAGPVGGWWKKVRPQIGLISFLVVLILLLESAIVDYLLWSGF